VNFVAIPDGISSPVFFVADDTFLGVFDKHSIVDRFQSAFEFRVKGFPITDFESVSNGAVVFGVPLETVTLDINDHPHNVSRNATYSDVQELVSSSPSTVLFCDITNTILQPRHYPTALQLFQKNPLKQLTLTSDATLNSLDLFMPLTITFYDPNHRPTTRPFLWLRKGRTVGDLASEVPRWFNFTPHPSHRYAVSPIHPRIQRITRIFPDDMVITTDQLRVDLLTGPLPRSCREIRDIFDTTTDIFPMIEVQAISTDGEPSGYSRTSTVGFFVIQKNTTANSIAKSATKKQIQNFLIKGEIDGRPIIIEGRDQLFKVFQVLGDKDAFSGQRPLLMIQVGKPSKK
jgi:hypothetical protein